MTIAIPDPAGYTELFPWQDMDGLPARTFHGSEWPFEVTDPYGHYHDLGVSISGIQYLHGIERAVVFGGNLAFLTVQQARDLATVLGTAADEVEFMADLDRLDVA